MQQLVRRIRAWDMGHQFTSLRMTYGQSGDLLASQLTYLWCWRRVLLEFMIPIFFFFLLSSAPTFRGLWFTCFSLLAGCLPLPSWHLLLVYYLSGTLWSPEQHTYIFAFIISNCLWPSVKMPHKTTRKWQNCKLKTKKKKTEKKSGQQQIFS